MARPKRFFTKNSIIFDSSEDENQEEKEENVFKNLPKEPSTTSSPQKGSPPPPQVEANSNDSAATLRSPTLFRRAPYSQKEDTTIVFHVVDNEKSYLDAINLAFWMSAEKKKLCPGRSASSMHERYRKLVTRLHQFPIDPKLAASIEKFSRATAEGRKRIRESLIGGKEDGRVRFNVYEDRALINYIQEQNKKVQNQLFWSRAEELKICPGRSGYSMMLRYRKLRKKHGLNLSTTGRSTKKPAKTRPPIYIDSDDSCCLVIDEDVDPEKNDPRSDETNVADELSNQRDRVEEWLETSGDKNIPHLRSIENDFLIGRRRKDSPRKSGCDSDNEDAIVADRRLPSQNDGEELQRGSTEPMEVDSMRKERGNEDTPHLISSQGPESKGRETGEDVEEPEVRRNGRLLDKSISKTPSEVDHPPTVDVRPPPDVGRHSEDSEEEIDLCEEEPIVKRVNTSTGEPRIPSEILEVPTSSQNSEFFSASSGSDSDARYKKDTISKVATSPSKCSGCMAHNSSNPQSAPIEAHTSAGPSRDLVDRKNLSKNEINLLLASVLEDINSADTEDDNFSTDSDDTNEASDDEILTITVTNLKKFSRILAKRITEKIVP